MGIVARDAEGLRSQSRWQREAQRREHRRECPRYAPRQEEAGPLLRTPGASDPADTHVPQRVSEDPLRSLLRQPGPAQRVHDASQIGTSTDASRLAGGVNRGGRGSRTSGLVPQCGHGVRAIPVTSCLHCPTLFGLRRGGSAGWPRRSRQRRRARAVCRLARQPSCRMRMKPRGNPCNRKRRIHASASSSMVWTR